MDLTLYNGVSVTKVGMDYSVLEGQVFGIECRTQEQFQVNWWHGTSLIQGMCTKSHNILVCFIATLLLTKYSALEVTNDGTSINYPKSEIAGQLYSYRMSQNVVILGTRGLVGNSGISIGLKQVASGMYKCEAINNKENNSINITVTINGKFTI